MKPMIARGLAFLVLLTALGGATYLIARSLATPPEDPDQPLALSHDDEEDGTDLPAGDRLERVRELARPVYAEFHGRVIAGSGFLVRAPLGMIIPIEHIRKEQGDVVKKGDVLLEFYAPPLYDAIEKARAAGNDADVKRFESYIPFLKLRSEVDGQVLEISTQEGQTPLNRTDGLPLMTLADESSYTFKVDIPVRSVKDAAFLGAKLGIRLQVEEGAPMIDVEGVVTQYEEGPPDYQRVLFQLPAAQGVEVDLRGVVRIPVATEVVGLMPKNAIIRRTPVPVARVWEAATRSLAERTLVLGDEMGDDIVVTAGVLAGESVVVPSRTPRR